jgi:hypothetical protein
MANTAAAQNVEGAQAQWQQPEKLLHDATLDGVYKQNWPWARVPTPDPKAESLEQYLVDTALKPQVLERILHADIGDPELDMVEKPPYIRVYPKGISLAVFPGTAEIAMHNEHGVVIEGGMSMRNPSEQLSIGGICSMNPQLMSCIASTSLTPIPTFIYSMRTTPLYRSVAKAAKGSIEDKAKAAPAQAVPEAKPTLKDYQMIGNSGQSMVVRGVANQEEARAQALLAMHENGTGSDVAGIYEIGAQASA